MCLPICNKKLSYSRGTARCAMLVNSCCFTSYESYKCFKQQVTFKVIWGHWQWCHSTGHIQFPISLPLQLCLYLAPLTRYYQFNRGHVTLNTSLLGIIYHHHACTRTRVYQLVHKIWSAELHQLQSYDWSKILKTGSVTLTTPLLGVVCHCRLGFDTVYLHAQFDNSSFSCSRDITEGVKIDSGSRDPDHAPFKGDLSSLCRHLKSLHACKIWPH